MARALSNYSIEGEQNILLSFFDGSNVRCRPAELPTHLAGSDLERVRTALQTRREFIRRVLPPTVTMIMLAATVALGRYDYHRYQDSAHRRLSPSPVSDARSKPDTSRLIQLINEQSAATQTLLPTTPAARVSPHPSTPFQIVHSVSGNSAEARRPDSFKAQKSDLNHYPPIKAKGETNADR